MSEAFVISSRCTEPELALELVRELVSPASQADVVAEGIRFPSRRDAVAGMLGAAGAAELENHWRERLYARSDVMRLGAVRVDVLGRALRPLWGSNEALGPALTKAAAVCEAVFASYHESAAGPGRLGGRL